MDGKKEHKGCKIQDGHFRNETVVCLNNDLYASKRQIGNTKEGKGGAVPETGQLT